MQEYKNREVANGLSGTKTRFLYVLLVREDNKEAEIAEVLPSMLVLSKLS